MLAIVLLGFIWVFAISSTVTNGRQHIQRNIKNGTKWIYVEFFDCPSILEINVSAISGALARWINEECAAALHCNLVSTLTANNVLVGRIFCGSPSNFITFLVLKNVTKPAYLHENHLDLNIIGKVIQSREHLLSLLLHSDLKIVTERTFYDEDEHEDILLSYILSNEMF